MEPLYSLVISHLGIYPKKVDTNLKRYVHTKVHSNIIYNSQYSEATSVSIYNWMDKKISYVCIHIVRYGVRVGEFQKKNQTGTLQEQITFNEARRGSKLASCCTYLRKE